MIYTRTIEKTPAPKLFNPYGTGVSIIDSHPDFLNKTFGFHNIKSIDISKTKKQNHSVGYIASILIDMDYGERFEINLFSSKYKRSLKLNRISWTDYCLKIFSKNKKEI